MASNLYPTNYVTSSITLDYDTQGYFINAASNITLTLPAIKDDGQIYSFMRLDTTSNTVTLTGTVNGVATSVPIYYNTPFTIYSSQVNSSWYFYNGYLSLTGTSGITVNNNVISTSAWLTSGNNTTNNLMGTINAVDVQHICNNLPTIYQYAAKPWVSVLTQKIPNYPLDIEYTETTGSGSNIMVGMGYTSPTAYSDGTSYIANASSVIINNTTNTNTAIFIANYNQAVSNNGSNSIIYGQSSNINMNNASTASSIIPVAAISTYASSGTSTNLYNILSNINVSAGGTITNAYQLYCSITNNGTITNNWGIYQNSGGYNFLSNYLAVGAGVTTTPSVPSNALDVQTNTIRVRSLATAGYVINNASGVFSTEALRPGSYYLPTITVGSNNTITTISGLSGVGAPVFSAALSSQFTFKINTFQTIPFNVINVDTYNGFSGTTTTYPYSYIIPVSGTYFIASKLRIQDNSTKGVSYGQGANSYSPPSTTPTNTNVDGYWFNWFVTNYAGHSNSSRNSSINYRIMKLTAGQYINVYAYCDNVSLSTQAPNNNVSWGTELDIYFIST
jgi:hypothetical protein